MGRDLAHHRASDRAGDVWGWTTWHENHLVPIIRNGKLEEVYWTYSYGPIEDESAPNGVGGVLVVCSETIEQVRTARRLAAERERQQLMLQQIPGFAALLAGPDHRYEYVNDAYREIAGERDFLNRTVREVFPISKARVFSSSSIASTRRASRLPPAPCR